MPIIDTATPRPDHPVGLEALLQAYVSTAARVAAGFPLPRGWCLHASRLSAQVLPRFGVPDVRVLGARAGVYNHAGWHLSRQGVPQGAWPDDAFSGGILGTGATTHDAWDGHAIAYLPGPDGTGWIVDPSFGQFARPAYGLRVGPLAIRTGPDFLDGLTIPTDVPGGIGWLEYRPHLRPLPLDVAERALVGVLADQTSRLLEHTLARQARQGRDRLNAAPASRRKKTRRCR